MQVKLNEYLWVFNYLNLQNEKKIVLDFYNLLQKCKIEEIPEVLFDYCLEDLIWRGFHPFNEIKGINNLSCKFWKPLRKSFSSLQRRMDIFIAGNNVISNDKETWVVSMGHLMGLFDNPWINIKHTNKII